MFWCSLTENYNRDKEWGTCLYQEEKDTTEITPTATPTTEKTTEGKKTTPAELKNVSNCSSNMFTHEGDCCILPFSYNGNIYNRCTSDNHHLFWCSLTENYNRDKEWGTCLYQEEKDTSERTATPEYVTTEGMLTRPAQITEITATATPEHVTTEGMTATPAQIEITVQVNCSLVYTLVALLAFIQVVIVLLIGKAIVEKLGRNTNLEVCIESMNKLTIQ